MSCPTNCVSASWPCTWLTRNASLMCILLKSPVRSCTVTSVIRPTSLPGSSVGVSPRACLLNMSGARRLYHTFAFHLSLILRAAARDFFSAMRAVRKGEAYLRVLGWSGVPRHRTRCPLQNEDINRGGLHRRGCGEFSSGRRQKSDRFLPRPRKQLGSQKGISLEYPDRPRRSAPDALGLPRWSTVPTRPRNRNRRGSHCLEVSSGAKH